MKVDQHIEAQDQAVRRRTGRAARATQVARLWALCDVGDDEREALRSRLLGLEVGDPAGDPAGGLEG